MNQNMYTTVAIEMALNVVSDFFIFYLFKNFKLYRFQKIYEYWIICF